MATTKTPPAVRYPAPAGCSPHERSDWLPNLPLDWLQELKARHVELANDWAGSVARVGEIREEARLRESQHRREVRSAVAAGQEPPARPDGVDPALRDAEISVALEDVADARDDLSEFVLTALSTLRSHRAALRPHLPVLSPSLLNAISTGSADQRSIVAERLRRQAAVLEGDGVETINVDEKETTDA